MNTLGHGIGLRTPHYREILNGPVEIDWFEIISENFFQPGGNPRRVLRAIRERFPVVMHGVSLSVGSTDPLNEAYLSDLVALAREIEPALISDHLCWSGHGGHYAHDLLPLPYTEEALNHIANRIDQVQERLGRQFLVENVSSYMAFAHSTMTEWEFLAALCAKTGCGLLLDVNNVFVSAHNHNFDARKFIDSIPTQHIAQIHLAGHTTRGELLLDTHDHPVRHEVWDLYRYTIQRAGSVPTLIEWDENIPSLARLLEESRKARDICDEVQGSAAQIGKESLEESHKGRPGAATKAKVAAT